jgi:MYXO-CTERM domain-containing protein
MEIREWGLRIDYQTTPNTSSVPDGSGALALFALGFLGLVATARKR